MYSPRQHVSTSLKQQVFALSIGSAVCTALAALLENVVINHFIRAHDAIIAALSSLLMGAWIGVLLSFLFALLIGRRVARDFRGFTFTNLGMQWHAFKAGLLSALATVLFLWANRFSNPATLIVLSTLQIPLAALIDSSKGLLPWRTVRHCVILALMGGLTSLWEQSLQTFLQTSLALLVIVGGCSNVAYLWAEYEEQQGVQRSDSVNMTCWRFLWHAITATLLASGYTSTSNQTNDLLICLQSSLWSALPILFLLMVFAILSVGWKIAAKKTGAVSIILIITSIQVFLGYFLMWIGHIISPQYFPDLPTNPLIWLARLLGACLILISIWLLYRKGLLSPGPSGPCSCGYWDDRPGMHFCPFCGKRK